eukprot:gnl/TRDRNA2_/TRDRNA2_172251_c0_seq3.p1 gnl/TRDRNA2_/TRDRNA2_172251_c0~~gnl/TRDRNA2_/TRDRNA2_172251_c0_seq3.p1  ORF type:complete len:704 (-),score=234.13 gnl/TRDRNA2_/TRDRNA2_172251_c0_seq3:133-2154(-)
MEEVAAVDGTLNDLFKGLQSGKFGAYLRKQAEVDPAMQHVMEVVDSQEQTSAGDTLNTLADAAKSGALVASLKKLSDLSPELHDIIKAGKQFVAKTFQLQLLGKHPLNTLGDDLDDLGDKIMDIEKHYQHREVDLYVDSAFDKARHYLTSLVPSESESTELDPRTSEGPVFQSQLNEEQQEDARTPQEQMVEAVHREFPEMTWWLDTKDATAELHEEDAKEDNAELDEEFAEDEKDADDTKDHVQVDQVVKEVHELFPEATWWLDEQVPKSKESAGMKDEDDAAADENDDDDEDEGEDEANKESRRRSPSPPASGGRRRRGSSDERRRRRGGNQKPSIEAKEKHKTGSAGMGDDDDEDFSQDDAEDVADDAKDNFSMENFVEDDAEDVADDAKDNFSMENFVEDDAEDVADDAKDIFSMANFIEAGYTAQDMKEAGFTAAELKGDNGIGYSVPNLLEAGYSIDDIRAAGYSDMEYEDDVEMHGDADQEEDADKPDEVKAVNATKKNATKKTTKAAVQELAAKDAKIAKLEKELAAAKAASKQGPRAPHRHGNATKHNTTKQAPKANADATKGKHPLPAGKKAKAPDATADATKGKHAPSPPPASKLSKEAKVAPKADKSADATKGKEAKAAPKADTSAGATKGKGPLPASTDAKAKHSSYEETSSDTITTSEY